MTSNNDNLLAFRCEHCDKRLKTRLELSGRKLKCPKCGQAIRVPNPIDLLSEPNPPPAKPSLLDEEDPFKLSAPAIGDLAARKSAAEDVRASKAKQREIDRAKQANRRQRALELSQSSSPDQPVPQKPVRRDETGKGREAIPVDEDVGIQQPKGKSIFDDDHLELDELRLEPETIRPAKKPSFPSAAGAGSVSADDLNELKDLVPDPGTTESLPPLVEDEVLENAEYRVACRVCGTAQYVSPSAKGMKIKCPDCHSDFKVPPPPANWKPSAKKKAKTALPAGFGYVPEPGEDDSLQARQKQRTSQLLEKAKVEISEDDEEKLYDSDFDTASFVQGTFGFLRDPLTMAQIGVYGLVFALLFGLARFSLSDTDSQFGRGFLLVSVILIPLIGFLFALPMLSGCLALIEAAANKQRFVRELPAFNIFDNFADLLVLAVALLASVVPGFVIGSLLGGEESSTFFGVAGMILSGYLLFPIFLLSMMDNGSLVNPISGSVIQSLSDASEAWGGYYLKTLVATATMMILWLILLGRAPPLAGIAGLLLPLYIFFTCQQIGTLADQIGDSLSFEFKPAETEEEESDSSAAI